jgi:ribosomal-protein-alanine N-acetyltransferase
LAKGKVTIRDAVGHDLSRVIAIERAAFAHPWSLDAFCRELSLPFSRVIVAETASDGVPSIAGFLCRWIVADECHILNLAVEPTLRRMGIGRQLMMYAIAESTAAGIRLITLEVRRSNVVARHLYRTMAFEERRLRKNYYGLGEDAIIMELGIPEQVEK